MIEITAINSFSYSRHVWEQMYHDYTCPIRNIKLQYIMVSPSVTWAYPLDIARSQIRRSIKVRLIQTS